MRCLVTGHAGYIGGVLLEHLRERNHETHGFDIAADAGDDIRDRERVEAAIDDFGPDVVYHLAAEADVWAGDWRHLVATNVLGSVHVAGAAAGADVPVVHASSVAARGTFNLYGRSKGLAETALEPFDAVAIIRFPNVIGRNAPRGQVQDMIEQGLAGEIEVWGHGELRRSYVDVGDLADFLHAIDPTADQFDGPTTITAHTATNARIAEQLRSIIGDETGTRPSIVTIDRSPPAPEDLSATGVSIPDPTPLQDSLRSQVRHALD